MGILSALFGDQYTIGELMNIDSGRQQKAAGCIPEFIKTYHELKPETLFDKFRSLFAPGRATVNSYYLIFKFIVTSETGSKQEVLIRTNPDFDLTKWQSNKVKIYCSCPDFKYRSAYILDKRGSLFKNDRINVSLGAATSISPKKLQTTLLCKHAFSALQWLVQNYQSVMRTI